MSIWSSIIGMLLLLSRYLIHSTMIKFIHKSRSYQNHNLQFISIWPIRINAFTIHYFCPLNYNLYISHTITSLFVTASDSFYTCPKHYTTPGDNQKAISPFVSPMRTHTPSRELPPKPVFIPRPRGKPSPLVTPSNVRSCTVPSINKDFLPN